MRCYQFNKFSFYTRIGLCPIDILLDEQVKKTWTCEIMLHMWRDGRTDEWCNYMSDEVGYSEPQKIWEQCAFINAL